MTQDEISEIDEARNIAVTFGTRMCDEHGDTHGEELYCVGIDDIRAIIKLVAAKEPIDIDELCATHNKIGYKQGYRAGAKDAREDCANLCEELGGTIYVGGRSQGADYCAAKIRERGAQ